MKPRLTRAFTLLEVMIVVTIVGILSMLAMVAVGRIKEKAARTVITNNLRQLYNAKEYYYSETGDTMNTAPASLLRAGYINANTKNQVMGLDNLAARSGWHYYIVLRAGQPVIAYQGVKPGNAAPTGEIIWYPAPPGDPASYFSAHAATTNSAPATQPAAQTAAPPVPAGKVGGSTPWAPWIVSNIPNNQFRALGHPTNYFTEHAINYVVGAVSPDGTSRVRVTKIESEPGGPTLNQPFDPASPRWEYTFPPGSRMGTIHYFTITISNGHGDTTFRMPVEH